ncbi:putative E3 ubiquitin protein ligase DRIPH [Raphanus sativus]|nr:putative E3 ubiquitin protein ligase DRIPH [Raphanus sativus]
MTVLKAKRQDMKACFTCPICNNLYDRATTISECLHTFCRRCIEDKLVVENLKACPVCNVDLGVAPLDKLRGDNTWDELRIKVFKQKPKRKKTSLPSSLAAVASPRVSTSPESATPDAPLESEKLEEEMEAVSLNQSLSAQVSNFRRRVRKNLAPKRNENPLEPQQDHVESLNGLEIVLNIEQDNSLAGASTSNGCIQKVAVSSVDPGKSLSNDDKEVVPQKSNGSTVIVETVITSNGKSNQNHGSSSGGETGEVPSEANGKHVLAKEVSGEKPKNNGVEKQRKISGKKGKGKASSPRVLRPRKQEGNMISEADREAFCSLLAAANRYTERPLLPQISNPYIRTDGNLPVSYGNKKSSDGASEAAITKEAENKAEGSNKKVWLSLIAAANQNTNRTILPQISNPYIRTDGNLPVSYVKKYLACKLGLQREDEVEIWLRQEPVSSTQKLHNLVDWWVQSTPVAERKSAMVGSSGAEFVMVLHYSGSRLFE